MLVAQLGSFLIGLEEHVDDQGERRDGRDQSDEVQAAIGLIESDELLNAVEAAVGEL